jgi:multimeric flavodoxin WrbA
MMMPGRIGFSDEDFLTTKGTTMAKIVMLTGSPHKDGTSLRLADAFERGARAAGNDVYRFDAGLAEDLQPLRLEEGSSEVAIPGTDTYERQVLPRLLEADVVVLVSSLYYYGMNAALKTAVDRFYRFNHELKDKKAVVLATGYGTHDDLKVLMDWFATLQRYMRWENLATVEVPGSWTESNMRRGIEQAEKAGRAIR